MSKAAPATTEDKPGVEMLVETMVVHEVEVEAEVEISKDDPLAEIYAKRAEQIRVQAGEVPAPQVDVAPEPTKDDEIVVVVNGHEKLVAKSRIDAAGGVVAYQKSAAASEMLNQASAQVRRLKEQESVLLERERVLSLREQEINRSAKTAEPSAQDALRQAAKEYHEAILDGNMDKASELLIQLQATPRAMANSNEDVAASAVRAAKAELERERRDEANRAFEERRQDAVLEFQERFPDVADDPKLRAMADSETITIQQAHPAWTPKEIITEAAQSVRKWITERTAIPSAALKLEAKRGTSNIRGGSAVSVARQAPPPQSKAGYVEQLRKSRGLE